MTRRQGRRCLPFGVTRPPETPAALPGATPEPPLRSAPARWYLADTPATRRAQGPARWAGNDRLAVAVGDAYRTVCSLYERYDDPGGQRGTGQAPCARQRGPVTLGDLIGRLAEREQYQREMRRANEVMDRMRREDPRRGRSICPSCTRSRLGRPATG